MSAGADRQVCDMLCPLSLSLCFGTSRRNVVAEKHVPLYVPPSLSVLWDLTAEYGGGKTCIVICSAISLCALRPHGGIWGRKNMYRNMCRHLSLCALEPEGRNWNIFLVTLYIFICFCDSFVFCLSNCITGPKFLSLVISAFNF